jgi:hypothetical protein
MAYIDYDHRDHFSVIHARFDDAAANDACLMDQPTSQ